MLQSRLAPPPSSQPFDPRHLSSHPWQTVGHPPQSVGQYQGMCAFMAGWIHEPTQSLDPHLSHMSQTQGIAHTNTGLSSKEYRTVFYEDHKNVEIICTHEQFPSHARLAHGRIRCARWEKTKPCIILSAHHKPTVLHVSSIVLVRASVHQKLVWSWVIGICMYKWPTFTISLSWLQNLHCKKLELKMCGKSLVSYNSKAQQRQRAKS